MGEVKRVNGKWVPMFRGDKRAAEKAARYNERDTLPFEAVLEELKELPPSDHRPTIESNTSGRAIPCARCSEDMDDRPRDRRREKFEQLLAQFQREAAEDRAACEQAEAREKLDVWMAMHRGRPAPRGMW